MFPTSEDRVYPRTMRALRDDTRGLSTVEYILILVIVAITALLLWQSFGSSVNSRVDQATQSVASMDDRGGGGAAVASGDSAGSDTAMAITEGRQSGAGGGAGGMGTGTMEGASGGGGMATGVARPAGAAEGAGAGFGDDEGGGEGDDGELAEGGLPDLFLWIGWLLVLILGAVTVFSVLGKRIGKSK